MYIFEVQVIEHGQETKQEEAVRLPCWPEAKFYRKLILLYCIIWFERACINIRPTFSNNGVLLLQFLCVYLQLSSVYFCHICSRKRRLYPELTGGRFTFLVHSFVFLKIRSFQIKRLISIAYKKLIDCNNNNVYWW